MCFINIQHDLLKKFFTCKNYEIRALELVPDGTRIFEVYRRSCGASGCSFP